ncbi:hypothetical protein RB596_000313 [Gaeumannomyces avenae]
MAISDHIPGLEVTVRVDGELAIEHYDDAAYDEPCAVELDSSAGVRVVKYIEAKSGAPFSVNINRTVNFNFRGDHIGWSVAVDGGQSWWQQEGDSVSGFIKKCWKFGDLDIVSADTHITAEVKPEGTRGSGRIPALLVSERAIGRRAYVYAEALRRCCW